MESNSIIEAVQNNPAFLHLKKELIELPGRDDPFIAPRKILILEQCGLTNTRRGRIDLDIKNNPLTNEFIDPLDEFGLSRFYLDLASTSFGDVPTLLEFMAMPPAQSEPWFLKAREINPSMFEWVGEVLTALQKVDEEFFKSIGQAAPAQASPSEAELNAKKKRRRK